MKVSYKRNFYSLIYLLVLFLKLLVLSLVLFISTSIFFLSTNFISFLCYTRLNMPNTNWNKLTYIVEHYLCLHLQKKNALVKFFFDIAGFASIYLFLSLCCDNAYQFGKFYITIGSDIKDFFPIWLFYLAYHIDFSN